MEKNKQKWMILLVCIFAALLLVYMGLQTWNKKQDKKQESEAEAKKIYVTDIANITDIKYNVGSGDIHFVKKDDVWYNAQDNAFPLAQNYPEQMSADFSSLEADRELSKGDSLKDYGLSDPVYTVVLTDQDGNETKLYFGNATGDDYYLTVDDTERVYTVSNTIITDLQYTLTDMAQLDTYPSIGSGNLKKEVITKAGTSTTYDAENEDDAQSIAAAAGGLGAVTLSEAADYSVEDKDLTGFGLDESARTTVDVTYTENEKDATLKLYIGNSDGNGNKYVMLNDSRIVYLISEEVCSNILNEG
jgi:hypothetical protein